MRQMQKEITVNGKNHIISFNEITLNDKGWVCAYVTLKGKKVNGTYELNNCTYHEGNVFGVYTNHLHNQKQTMDEKYDDALKQIEELIEHFNKYESKIDKIQTYLEELYDAGFKNNTLGKDRLISTIMTLIQEDD